MKTNAKSVQKQNSELQSRPEQLSTGATDNRPKIDLDRRNRNRALPIEALLEVIRREAPDVWGLAEVVGKWVWVAFDGKQPPQITAAISQLGFHYNNRRRVWQHPCGNLINRADFDPRRRFRSYFPADLKPA